MHGTGNEKTEKSNLIQNSFRKEWKITLQDFKALAKRSIYVKLIKFVELR